jgi:hypothetical protein
MLADAPQAVADLVRGQYAEAQACVVGSIPGTSANVVSVKGVKSFCAAHVAAVSISE